MRTSEAYTNLGRKERNKLLAYTDEQIKHGLRGGEALANRALDQVEELDNVLEQTPEIGIAFTRMALSLCATKGHPARAAAFCRERFGDPIVARALSADSGTAGGFLVPEAFRGEVIELLRAVSAVRLLNPVVLPMNRGNLSSGKITVGATATYLAENQSIPASQPDLGQLKLTARKLAAICPVSNDIFRFAIPAADRIIRDELIAALALAEDQQFLRGDGLSFAPRGLRHWAPAANQINVNATVSPVNVAEDLGKLESALLSGNCRMIRPTWLMAPRVMTFLKNLRNADGARTFPEMVERATLSGYPFIATNNIPTNLVVTDQDESEVYLVDAADVVIGEAELVIDAMRNGGAYYDENSNLISSFSADQSVIRIVANHDLAMRHVESVAVLIDCDWVL